MPAILVGGAGLTYGTHGGTRRSAWRAVPSADPRWLTRIRLRFGYIPSPQPGHGRLMAAHMGQFSIGIGIGIDMPALQHHIKV